jgi:hypothetical protein
VEHPVDFFSRPDIHELHEAFSARRSEVVRSFCELDSRAFNWRPEPDQWSVAQCLDHLCQTGFAWANHLGPLFWASLRHGAHHDEPSRPGRAGKWIIGLMENQNRRMKAPALFLPRRADDYEPRDVLRAFVTLGEGWEATVRRASQLDLGRLRIGSPASPLLRMPVGTWLYFLSAHEDRHIAQARRILEHPDFPH